MWLVAAIVTFVNALLTKSQNVRRIAVVFTSLAVAMLVVEIGFTIYVKEHPLPSITYDRPFAQSSFQIWDADVGYKPVSTAQVHARKVKNGQLVYDAHYTLDSLGRRMTSGNAAGPTIMFMGCSYTFGEGVNDNETLPAQFSAATSGRFNVVNLADLGYGPHQMLRLLETSPPRVPLSASLVIYQAIPQHVRRAIGKADWDLGGPRYVQSGDTVALAGPFYSPRVQTAIRQLRQSDFFQIMSNRLYFTDHFSDADLDTYTRIVEQAARVANRKLGATFLVVYWDGDDALSTRVLNRLQKSGLPLIRVSTIIPRDQWQQVRLPGDLHPGPEADRRIGLALATMMGENRRP